MDLEGFVDVLDWCFEQNEVETSDDMNPQCLKLLVVLIESQNLHEDSHYRLRRMELFQVSDKVYYDLNRHLQFFHKTEQRTATDAYQLAFPSLVKSNQHFFQFNRV